MAGEKGRKKCFGYIFDDLSQCVHSLVKQKEEERKEKKNRAKTGKSRQTKGERLSEQQQQHTQAHVRDIRTYHRRIHTTRS